MLFQGCPNFHAHANNFWYGVILLSVECEYNPSVPNYGSTENRTLSGVTPYLISNQTPNHSVYFPFTKKHIRTNQLHLHGYVIPLSSMIVFFNH